MSQPSDILIDPTGPTPDRMELHYRQQLSAMADGALAPDQARFLLRRLQHDHELASRWERWQVYGDAMRGHAHQLLPADFAERVSLALQDAPPLHATAGDGGRRLHALRWAGGGALAASVALVALFGLRPGGESMPGTVPADAAQVAASAAAEGVSAPLELQAPAQADTQPATNETAPMAIAAGGALAAGTAATGAASVQRRAQQRTSTATASPASRAAVSRVAASVPAPSAPAPATRPASNASSAPAPVRIVRSVGGDTQLAAQAPLQAPRQLPSNDPFSTPVAPRPWPRAVLPGVGQGAFNASFGEAVFAPASYPADQFLQAVPAQPAEDAEANTKAEAGAQ